MLPKKTAPKTTQPWLVVGTSMFAIFNEVMLALKSGDECGAKSSVEG